MQTLRETQDVKQHKHTFKCIGTHALHAGGMPLTAPHQDYDRLLRELRVVYQCQDPACRIVRVTIRKGASVNSFARYDSVSWRKRIKDAAPLRNRGFDKTEIVEYERVGLLAHMTVRLGGDVRAMLDKHRGSPSCNDGGVLIDIQIVDKRAQMQVWMLTQYDLVTKALARQKPIVLLNKETGLRAVLPVTSVTISDQKNRAPHHYKPLNTTEVEEWCLELLKHVIALKGVES